jgi:hypothetical protein
LFSVLILNLNPARGVMCITGGEAKRNLWVVPNSPKVSVYLNFEKLSNSFHLLLC